MKKLVLCVFGLAPFLPVATYADQNLAGNVTVTGGSSTGNLNVTGSLDIDGPIVNFGTIGASTVGNSLIFSDSTATTGTTGDTLTFSANRTSASWLWLHNASKSAMRLNSLHQLLLYQADGSTAGITLTPVSNQISLGTATLTGTGLNLTAGGALTVTGAFTASSGITNTNGTLTGGSTGLSLSAGGTNQNITITPSGSGYTQFNGKVGIGVAPLYYNLEVLGVPKFYPAAGGNNYVLLGAAGQSIGGSGVVVGYNQTYNGTAMTNSAYIQAESQGAAYRNLLLSPLGGNVGIGTTSPTSLLQVGTNVTNQGFKVGVTGNMANANAEILNNLAVLGANASSVSSVGAQAWNFYNGGSSPSWSGVMLQHSGTGVTGNQNGISAANQGALLFQNVSNGVIASNGASLSIAPAGAISAAFLVGGNVGIGTITPEAKLSLKGENVEFSIGRSAVDWSGYGRIGFTTNFDQYIANNAYFNGSAWSYVNAGGYGGTATRFMNSAGVFRFDTATGGTSPAWNTQLYIANGGNVGIGTTNPTQKLSVAGTVRAYAVVVDTGWSDYVFDKDYRLAPLSEVEQHIKAEKHLPGIPSAADVAEHGISLGDMQSKLLAKVEELTLHQIAQEKQLNAQASRLNDLERENETLKSRLNNSAR